MHLGGLKVIILRKADVEMHIKACRRAQKVLKWL